MTGQPPPATTDLSDAHPEAQVCDPVFQAFGGRPAFSGPIATLKVFEDNALVREAVEQPGEGRVLVLAGGGSPRGAPFGGELALVAPPPGRGRVGRHGAGRAADQIEAPPLG